MAATPSSQLFSIYELHGHAWSYLPPSRGAECCSPESRACSCNWPLGRGWQGELPLFCPLLGQAPIMFPGDHINEMEDSKLMYLCTAELRGPHCAMHTSAVPGILQGHRSVVRPEGQGQCNSVCASVFLSAWSAVQRHSNVCSVIKNVRKPPQTSELIVA